MLANKERKTALETQKLSSGLGDKMGTQGHWLRAQEAARVAAPRRTACGPTVRSLARGLLPPTSWTRLDRWRGLWVRRPPLLRVMRWSSFPLCDCQPESRRMWPGLGTFITGSVPWFLDSPVLTALPFTGGIFTERLKHENDVGCPSQRCQ